MKIVGELKAEHGVVDFLVLDLVDVFEGGAVRGTQEVVGCAACEYDCFEVELFAEFLAGIVEAAGQAHVPIGRAYEHVNAVERIAFGVVCGKGIVSGNLGVGMFISEEVVFDDDRQGEACDFAFYKNGQLAFGKRFEQGFDGLFRPVPARPVVVFFEHSGPKALVVSFGQAAEFDAYGIFHSRATLRGYFLQTRHCPGL